MRILGIDPGPKQSAFVLWDGTKIRSSGMTQIIEMVHRGLPHDLLCPSSIQGCTVAVEHLQCFGMPVGAETFETSMWIGEIRHWCFASDVPFIKVMRSDIKMHFCNSMRAKDSHIRAALIDRFGPPGTKKAPGLTYGLKKDIWSAFAIAVYAFDKSK